MAELLTLEHEPMSQPEHWVDATRRLLEAERDFVLHELENPNERNERGIPRANAVRFEWEDNLRMFTDLIKGTATREEAIAKIDAELTRDCGPIRGAFLQLVRSKLDIPHDTHVTAPARRHAA